HPRWQDRLGGRAFQRADCPGETHSSDGRSSSKGTQPMRAMRISQPASLDSIGLGTAEDRAPGPGEIRVRIRAACLNFRDNLVATGFFPAPDGLIPLSDGAGEVVEVGENVTEFAPGDAVVSTFHPA